MSKLVLPLILLLVNPSKLSLALSKTVRTCTPSHFNTGDHHSNLMCKDFSPFAVVEDGSYFIVDAVDSSATKFVNCVCSDCTVEGDRRPCGDGNECYDSCITSNCVCDEANIGPDQIDWTGGDSADCVIGASKTIPGASGQCAVIPAATASVGAGVSLAPCTSAISEVWEYTDMAFIQHAASGLVLVADDDRDSSTSVSVTTVPSMNAAQVRRAERSEAKRAKRGGKTGPIRSSGALSRRRCPPVVCYQACLSFPLYPFPFNTRFARAVDVEHD